MSHRDAGADAGPRRHRDRAGRPLPLDAGIDGPRGSRGRAGGTEHALQALELVEADADAILAALELEPPAASRHLILAKDAKTLQRHRRRTASASDSSGRAGGPGVRALAWGKRTLFGVDRITTPGVAADRALEDADGDGRDGFDPSATWTMFAGGDVLLDRGVHQTISIRGKGEDFPFDGGSPRSPATPAAPGSAIPCPPCAAPATRARCAT